MVGAVAERGADDVADTSCEQIIAALCRFPARPGSLARIEDSDLQLASSRPA